MTSSISRLLSGRCSGERSSRLRTTLRPRTSARGGGASSTGERSEPITRFELVGMSDEKLVAVVADDRLQPLDLVRRRLLLNRRRKGAGLCWLARRPDHVLD